MTFEDLRAETQTRTFQPIDPETVNTVYSGYHSESGMHNGVLAEEYCSVHNACTIEMTEDGKWLQDQIEEGHFLDLQVEELWEIASEQFAEHAVEDVACFVNGAQEDGVFMTIELDGLLENEMVTSLNEIDRQELENIAEEQGKEAVLDQIAQNEPEIEILLDEPSIELTEEEKEFYSTSEEREKEIENDVDYSDHSFDYDGY